MKPKDETVKQWIKDLKQADPPEDLTRHVMDQITAKAVDSPPQTLAWVFFITGFFFFCLFVVLAVGVRYWALQGVGLEGLNLARNASFMVSLFMGAAGCGLVRGGRIGVRTAYAVGLITASGCILSSVGLSLKLADLSAALVVLGYGACGAAIALILLKELRRNEYHGY
ncbi:hypothetical protein Dalk_4825 [Desulfatibacillum aliphaticivorans]|uniref:Uncharacterized protein n=1 Tax=Desulfatibacillum aliphaticivorans TaxID=218208 RepID=B8FD71_DESAL|nr:hypothetical protein [Desulfatibacillum aliphaticivorans]ACL06502.1 hypothetical protein Dalk_4825 [Desulfatibacillum aliphaticivorans]